MRRLYQTHWQEIQFADFAKLSSSELAGPEFYQAFYREFFRRYQRWEQLSPKWLEQKRRCADLVLARSWNGARILSVGCGLGIMEHHIHATEPDRDLFIHEVASSAWAWVGTEFAGQRKLIGAIPECVPKDVRFDMVFLSGVDYAMDDEALVGLLAAIRPFLTGADGAQCLLISGSFQDTPASLARKAVAVVRGLKAVAAAALDMVRLRPRGQFWGWTRTRNEYRSLMRHAGYHDIEDGFIDPDAQTLYWVAGRGSRPLLGT
jgi:hypothetical protein